MSDGQFDYQTVRAVLARRIGEAVLEAAELEATILTERATNAAQRKELMDQLERAQAKPDTPTTSE